MPINMPNLTEGENALKWGHLPKIGPKYTRHTYDLQKCRISSSAPGKVGLQPIPPDEFLFYSGDRPYNTGNQVTTYSDRYGQTVGIICQGNDVTS